MHTIYKHISCNNCEQVSTHKQSQMQCSLCTRDTFLETHIWCVQIKQLQNRTQFLLAVLWCLLGTKYMYFRGQIEWFKILRCFQLILERWWPWGDNDPRCADQDNHHSSTKWVLGFRSDLAHVLIPTFLVIFWYVRHLISTCFSCLISMIWQIYNH